MNTKLKKELAEKFNISVSTFYQWEKNKPELIRLIKLGIEYENKLKNPEIKEFIFRHEVEMKMNNILVSNDKK